MTPLSNEAREVARRARELIERDGWQQGAQGPVDTIAAPRCLMGAVTAQGPGHTVYFEIKQRLVDMLGASPTRWNDHPSRTKQDVLDLLERAEESA